MQNEFLNNTMATFVRIICALGVARVGVMQLAENDINMPSEIEATLDRYGKLCADVMVQMHAACSSGAFNEVTELLSDRRERDAWVALQALMQMAQPVAEQGANHE